ncbi:unnamed protein product [Leptidea sinapis]|uniref:Uncharacterized protein n=1 Tax=Leptidea sinapis TaxID=189913 RepID=A0A5E4PPD2_9NEOP|nr:unnamed protein product [Leptidea sinapis]
MQAKRSTKNPNMGPGGKPKGTATGQQTLPEIVQHLLAHGIYWQMSHQKKGRSSQDRWGKISKANDMSQIKDSLDAPSDMQSFSHWRANEGGEVPEPADDDDGDFMAHLKQMQRMKRSPRSN